MSVDYLSLECCNNVPHPVCTALVFTPYSLVLPINHVCHLLSSVFCLQLSISLLSLYFPFSSRPFLSLFSQVAECLYHRWQPTAAQDPFSREEERSSWQLEEHDGC